MKNYHKALLYLIFHQPDKIPALLRLSGNIHDGIKRYYRRDDGLAGPPATIALKVTYRCNLHCSYCKLWGKYGVCSIYGEKITEKEMNTAQIKSFLLEISPFKPHIYITGGEPLLRDDIFELICYASSRGLIVRMASNCTLLKEKAQAVVESKLTILSVSLDGLRDSNNDVRLGKDVFDKVVEGLRALKEARIKYRTRLPFIRIHTVISDKNYKDLVNLARFINDEIKADIWTFGLEEFTTAELFKTSSGIFKQIFGINQIFAGGLINEPAGIDFDYLNQQIRTILTSKWGFRFYPYPPVGSEKFDTELYFKHPERFCYDVFCAYPYVMSLISPQGDVAACCNLSECLMGNILDDGFMNIWNNEKYRRFRKIIKNGLLPTCTRCASLYFNMKYVGKDKKKFVLKNPFLSSNSIKDVC